MITRREPACGLEAKPQESFSARTNEHQAVYRRRGQPSDESGGEVG